MELILNQIKSSINSVTASTKFLYCVTSNKNKIKEGSGKSAVKIKLKPISKLLLTFKPSWCCNWSKSFEWNFLVRKFISWYKNGLSVNFENFRPRILGIYCIRSLCHWAMPSQRMLPESVHKTINFFSFDSQPKWSKYFFTYRIHNSFLNSISKVSMWSFLKSFHKNFVIKITSLNKTCNHSQEARN